MTSSKPRLPRPEFAMAFFIVLELVVSGCRDTEPPLLVGPEHSDCASCHLDDFRGVDRPKHDGVLPTTCWVCHTQSSWHPRVHNHAYPLDGAHADTPCFSCHVGTPPVFAGRGSQCVDCHRSAFVDNRLPWHATFSTSCADCHSTSHWTPADHAPAWEPPPEEPEAIVVEDLVDAGMSDAGPALRRRRRHVDVVTRPSRR